MSRQLSLKDLELKAEAIREDVIRMLEHAGSGHSAGSLGQADIFTALYFDVLKHDPKNPDWDERDILIQSNGHTVPVRYAAMAEAGYFPREELLTLRKFGSRLQGHPERKRLPGLESTSGPLGSGLSQACGIALALRMNQQGRRWVYVTTGDGELDEGNNWEAIMLASKYKLSNITAIVDRNNIQIDGRTEDVMPLEDLRAKWEAFGWHVLEIDGNNIEAVINACAEAKAITEKPVVILAHTVPGKGVEFMEYDFRWHGIPPGIQDIPGDPPKLQQAKVALKELRAWRDKIEDKVD
jgi:transketolase